MTHQRVNPNPTYILLDTEIFTNGTKCDNKVNIIHKFQIHNMKIRHSAISNVCARYTVASIYLYKCIYLQKKVKKNENSFS